MSMLRPMRNDLFKYRKRKSRSIDGSVAGAPYARYSRSRRPVSGLPHGSRRPGYHHDLYMWGSPREYRPSLNAPAVQSQEYLTNENWDSHMVRHSADPRLSRPLPELPVAEEETSYSEFKTASEFFLRVMEIQYKPLEEGQKIPTSVDIWGELFGPFEEDILNAEIKAKAIPESTPEDVVREFIDIAGALDHLQTVFPPEHPDITSLKTALDDILDDPEARSKLESIAGDLESSNLGTDDPYANDPFEAAEQCPDEQMEVINKAFERPPMSLAADAGPGENRALSGDYIFDESLIDQGGFEQVIGQEGLFDAEAPGIGQEEIMSEEFLPWEAFTQHMKDAVEEEGPLGIIQAPEFRSLGAPSKNIFPTGTP